MKIVICDDNLNIVDEVKNLLDEYALSKNISLDISTFNNGQAVLESDERFNIAILDVEMDNMNGIKLGEELRKRNPHIILIYVTAHRKYLDDALNLNAARFFEKPLDSQRFYRGLRDAIKRIDNTSISFYLKDKKVTERISAQDIIFVEIEKRKTRIVTREKEYHSDHHMNFWKENLTSTIFISPHKSYIINFNYVTTYERDYVILDEQYKVSIARNKQADFYQKFMRFVEGK